MAAKLAVRASDVPQMGNGNRFRKGAFCIAAMRSAKRSNPPVKGVPLLHEPLAAHEELVAANPERPLPVPGVTTILWRDRAMAGSTAFSNDSPRLNVILQ